MGRVEDRLSKGLYEYKDGYGRRSVRYVKYLLKEGISREEVEEYARLKGCVVPLEHFEEVRVSRGRPRKESKELLGSVASEVLEKKKRGRPRKEKEVCSNVRGEELIASLLEEAGLEKKGDGVDGEEETRVIRFKINGKEYLKSEDNVLYDNKSHEVVGIWNVNSGSIEDIPNEEE